MITTEQFMKSCGCRSAGECTHNNTAEFQALNALVDEFAKAMKRKLRAKLFSGRSCWDDVKNAEGIRAALLEHAARGVGQWIDVANFAAMLWNMEQP